MAVAGDLACKDLITFHCNSLTPTEAMQPSKPQLSLMRKEDSALYQKAVGLAIIRLTEILNVVNTITESQTDDLIARIGKKFYYFRLDEVLYVFEKAINGRYGRMFNVLDASVVMTWLEDYDVNERTQDAIELARQQLGEPKRPLTKQELTQFLEKAKIKNTNPFVDTSHIRTKDKIKAADQDFAAFRRQYFQQQREAQQQANANNDPDPARIDHQPERVAQDAQE